MRFLGLDLGSKRIGLALSDEQGEFAFPEGALERRGRRKDLAALCALIEERGVGGVVVGLPMHMDGRKGPEAQAARDFADALAAASERPVELIDERWTSREAERVLAEGGRSGRRARREKGNVDALAAAIILRTWLERRSNTARREP